MSTPKSKDRDKPQVKGERVDRAPRGEIAPSRYKPKKFEALHFEVNLLSRPFFVLSRKGLKELFQKAVKEQRSPIRYEYEITLGGKRVKGVWEVIPTVTWGYSGPFDKKVFVTVQQIIIQNLPIRENPIRLGSLYNLCRLMEIADSGKNKRMIKEALIRIGSTTIYAENSFWLKGQGDYWRVEGKRGGSFHLWDVYWRGDRLPDGRIAECIYLYLNPPYLISLNDYYIKTLDYKYYRSLRSPIAQRLYELLSLKFYGLQDSDYVRFSYSELCQLLPLTPQKYFSKAQQVLQTAHDELIKTGFLAEVIWEGSSKEKPWFIQYFPGPRALDELARARRGLAAEREEFELPMLYASSADTKSKEPWEVKALVEDILEVTGDEKSRLFYTKVAQRCPSDLIYRVLSEVKDEWQRGKVRKSTGALFTDKIKRYCQELGIDLGLKSSGSQ